MRKVELLAPAKDLAIGIAAINNGADAVYIGAPAFGARKAASNSVEDIRTLVEYAHRFYCRVFVTLNTILYDNELAEAEQLIRELYTIGVDALIVQDTGILQLDLPPISLHASTQMHNYDLERIKFLDNVGFQRIVLARELSLEQIRNIRKEVKAELEVFIHGALCVSMSGQCYLSSYLNGRSANRGECSQPCRMKWSVKDSNGKLLIKDRYLLSLKDLNLSSYIEDLIDAGVDSFKIEGRLKDENYVVNITNHYYSLIDSALKNRNGVERLGSGIVSAGFETDTERSFNRGYTDYFFTGRKTGMVNMDTPKSMGKKLGAVKQVKGNRLLIDTSEIVNNGDGLCYLDRDELKGIRVNSADGQWLTCNEAVNARPGTILYRNYDHQFVMRLEKSKSVRKIKVIVEAIVEEGKLRLCARDEDGVVVSHDVDGTFENATNPAQKERLIQQLGKWGDSDFLCDSVNYTGDAILFIPSAIINEAKRDLQGLLEKAREEKREVVNMEEIKKGVQYKTEIDWHHNVVNQKAALFYQEHGAGKVEQGFEIATGKGNRDLMHTRYCLLFELGRCRKQCKNDDLKYPLYLFNEQRQFRLDFECGECFMKVISEE